MRPNSRTTAQRALVSLLFSHLTLEALDSVAMFAGGLATALMEEAASWLVHGGALAFELATDSYVLLSRTFVTAPSRRVPFYSLVIMTEPYASHDASEIERTHTHTHFLTQLHAQHTQYMHTHAHTLSHTHYFTHLHARHMCTHTIECIVTHHTHTHAHTHMHTQLPGHTGGAHHFSRGSGCGAWI